MTARVPESGKIDSIVAEQDVVIDGVDNPGRPVHATGGEGRVQLPGHSIP